MNSSELENLRAKIDRIDQRIQHLLSERATCAQHVAAAKIRELGGMAADEAGHGNPSFYRAEREAQILRRVQERDPGPLPAASVARIFREIMSACLALEAPLSVAYLGPEGTFTQAAALKHFGHAATTSALTDIADVFDAVQRDRCDYGVVPVENSTEGIVTHTLDKLLNSPLKICGEVELPIRLHLLVSADRETIGEPRIQRIVAHQQAIAQSRQWLRRHFPGIGTEAVSSNGEAARIASADNDVAAIAGDNARQLYALQSLHEDIQDATDNTTRFIVIGKDDVPPSGQDKTALVVSTPNKPGALFHLLEPLQQSGISLTRIETRPSRTENWAYVFFMEFEGHCENPAVRSVIDAMQAQALFARVLGSFPRAVI